MNKVQRSIKQLRRHFRRNGNLLSFNSPAIKLNRKGLRFRLIQTICALLVLSFLSTSISAEPRAIVVGAQEFARSVRFGFFSNGWDTALNNWSSNLLLFLPGTEKGRKAQEISAVNRIVLLPGSNLKIRQGEPLNFSAIGYAADNTSVSGLKFSYTVEDVGRKLKPHNLPKGVFTAQAQGNFLVTAETGGLKATATVEVQANDALITLKRIKQYEARGNTAAAAKLKALGTYTSESISSKSLPKRVLDIPQVTESAQAENVHVKKGGPSTNETEPAENASPHRTKMMMRPIDDQGWGDNNWQTADDPGNQTGNPPGTSPDMAAGNGNFQFSAPVVSLPGRNIDINLALNYNSRLWSKSGNQMSYDSDRGFPAPGWELGYGKLMFMGTSGGCMLVDADGTRHGYTGTLSNYSSGNTHTTSFSGHTTDGTFIDYSCYYYSSPYGTSVSGHSALANGANVEYNSSTANGQQAFPTQIGDIQGNYITVLYVNNRGPEITAVIDTMGRVTTFNYDSSNRLISVAVPKFDNAGTRIAVQIHYKQINLNPGFAYPLTVDTANPSPFVIDAIYYPGTNTGYWFNDSDSYSSYGMISKIIEQRGMSWSGSGSDQGTVSQGTMSKQAVYNYTPTPDYTLTDAPTYTTLTESWDGMDTAAAVTSYDLHNNANPRTVTITQPNGVKSKQTSYNHPGVWDDGLIYQDETLDGSNNQLSKSVVTWAQGAYDSARPSQTEITDERGQVLKTTYTYGANYNQVTSQKEYDYDGITVLRDSQNTYENSSSYLDHHVLNLVKATEIYDGANNRAARTEYEYDNNAVVTGTQNHNLAATPGVTMHSAAHDPFTTDTVDGACASGSYNYSQCSYDGEIIYVPTAGGYEDTCYYQCYEYEQVSAYNPTTIFRGNVTKVTQYSDAANLTGAISQTKRYDDTGNLVAESASCCELKTYVYDDPNTSQIDTQYAYPVTQTRGSSDSNSTIRNTSGAVFDFNTGLVKQTTDPNGRTDSTIYDPDTLRPTGATSSTGAYSQTVYDESAMTITDEAHESGGALASRSITYLNGVGKITKQMTLGANNVYDTAEIKYNNLGQPWKQSRPYRPGDTLQWTETIYDLLGRTSQITTPDGSVSKTFYNETTRPDSATAAPGNTIRVVDPWGRERWGRFDAQGRMAEVAEPNLNAAVNTTGSVLSTGSLLTKYYYNTLGNLTETEQGVQHRKFKYDSLGRLTRQKLTEKTATLNDAGAYVGANQTGALWSDAFTYDERSNLTLSTDARGVITHFVFGDANTGASDPLSRLRAKHYEIPSAHDTSIPINAAYNVSYDYLTTGDQDRIQKVESSGLGKEEYTYDVEGRVQDYIQTVAARTSYPMTMSYLYDTLDRVKEITYPAQYGLTGSPRKVVQQTYDTASRLSTLKYNGSQQAGGIVYNAASQTTSVKVGVGTLQVTESYAFDPQTGLLTNQKVKRGSSVVLDLSYDYNRGTSPGAATGKTGQLSQIVNNLDSTHKKDRAYRYDALGRLIKATGGASGIWTQDYAYDRFGNRTSVTATGTAADTNSTPIPSDGIAALTYDANTNRITTAGFQYDVAGNQIRAQAEDGSWLKFEYDTANRLSVVKKDDGTLLQSFQYSPSGGRLINQNYISGEFILYANTGDTSLAEYCEYTQNVPTWTKSYTYFGDGLLSTISNSNGTETFEFNHPDRLGTRIITTPQGAFGKSEQVTLPFGTALNAESSVTNNKKRFTSYDRSATTGLDYAVNRSYDSKQGRFTQVDPIGMSAASLAAPQTLNLYSYCGNDPINHTDPSGLFWGALFKSIGKSLVGLLKRVLYAAIKAAITAAFIYITSGGNLGAAVASFIGSFVANLAFPKLGNVLTPSWNPEIRHPLDRSSVLSQYIISNLAAKGGKVLTPDQILKKTLAIVRNALKKQSCKDYISQSADSILPSDPLKTLNYLAKGVNDYQLINEGKYEPTNSNIIARGGIDELPGGIRMPTIRLFKPFFSDKLGLNVIAGADSKLGRFDKKALLLLHELKHVYSGGAPAAHDLPSGWNDDIINKCF